MNKLNARVVWEQVSFLPALSFFIVNPTACACYTAWVPLLWYVRRSLSFWELGRKVADCILVYGFGLAGASVVPIDRHIFRGIAKLQGFGTRPSYNLLTPKRYDELQTRLSRHLAPLAGHAQAILFAALLRSHSDT